jgi:alpha-mannosidase
MNNYWETNYKADQEGPTPFRYAIRPHGGPYDPVAAARFAVERNQPLVVVPTDVDAPAVLPSRLTVQPNSVLVTAFKPSRDGRALIVRLFNVTDKATKASLSSSAEQEDTYWMSDLAEGRGPRITAPLDVPPYGLVTLRVERSAGQPPR